MFFDILKNACLLHNTTPTGLVKELGLSSSKVTAWKNGSVPNGEILVKLADYLNCSVDYLLGRIDEPLAEQAVQRNNQHLSKDNQDLLEMYNNLDLTGKVAVVNTIKAEQERIESEKNSNGNTKIG